MQGCAWTVLVLTWQKLKQLRSRCKAQVITGLHSHQYLLLAGWPADASVGSADTAKGANTAACRHYHATLLDTTEDRQACHDCLLRHTHTSHWDSRHLLTMPDWKSVSNCSPAPRYKQSPYFRQQTRRGDTRKGDHWYAANSENGGVHPCEAKQHALACHHPRHQVVMCAPDSKCYGMQNKVAVARPPKAIGSPRNTPAKGASAALHSPHC